jgi:hypothetical protein
MDPIAIDVPKVSPSFPKPAVAAAPVKPEPAKPPFTPAAPPAEAKPATITGKIAEVLGLRKNGKILAAAGASLLVGYGVVKYIAPRPQVAETSQPLVAEASKQPENPKAEAPKAEEKKVPKPGVTETRVPDGPGPGFVIPLPPTSPAGSPSIPATLPMIPSSPAPAVVAPVLPEAAVSPAASKSLVPEIAPPAFSTAVPPIMPASGIEAPKGPAVPPAPVAELPKVPTSAPAELPKVPTGVPVVELPSVPSGLPMPSSVVPPSVVPTPPTTELPKVPTSSLPTPPTTELPKVPTSSLPMPSSVVPPSPLTELPKVPVSGLPVTPPATELPKAATSVPPAELPKTPPSSVVPPSVVPPAVLPTMPEPSKPLTIEYTKPATLPEAKPVTQPERTATTTYDVDLYEPTKSDTYATISKDFYNDAKFAAALAEYNGRRALQGGVRVEVPPIHVLKKRHPQLIGAAVVPASGSVPSKDPWGPSTEGTPVKAAPPRTFTVPSGGLRMAEIAREVLGSPTRWSDLYDANPQLSPSEVLPAGTVLKIPTELKNR